MTIESDHFRNRAKACARLAQHGDAAQWANMLQMAAKWARLADSADNAAIAVDVLPRTRSAPKLQPVLALPETPFASQMTLPVQHSSK